MNGRRGGEENPLSLLLGIITIIFQCFIKIYRHDVTSTDYVRSAVIGFQKSSLII